MWPRTCGRLLRSSGALSSGRTRQYSTPVEASSVLFGGGPVTEIVPADILTHAVGSPVAHQTDVFVQEV